MARLLRRASGDVGIRIARFRTDRIVDSMSPGHPARPVSRWSSSMIATVLLLSGQLSAIVAPPLPEYRARSPMTLSEAVSRATADSPRRRAAASIADGARDAARYAGQMVNPFFELRTENWSPSMGSPSPSLDVVAVIAQPL